MPATAILPDIAATETLVIDITNEVRQREKLGAGTAQTMARIQRALEAAGINFIDEDGAQGPGLRLKKPLWRRWPDRSPGPENVEITDYH
jgi:hypothetical protein